MCIRDRFEGAGLDGVVAKSMDAAYTPGKRTMLKVKHKRTAEVVVFGYRAVSYTHLDVYKRQRYHCANRPRVVIPALGWC